MVAPGWLDRYLARSAVSGQKSAELDDAHRADNLFAPAPGDYGAHGRFDQDTRHRVMARSGTAVRWAIGCAVGATLLGTIGFAARKNARRR
jgi:hypothetical protein